MARSNPRVKQANAVGIVDFCQAAGIELNQISSNCYRGVDHDSLVITPSKNAWIWNSRQQSGYGALSFAQNYALDDEQNLTPKNKFWKAVDLVNSYGLSPSPEPQVQGTNQSAYQVGQKNMFTSNFDRTSLNLTTEFTQANNYLTNNRSLNPALVKQLHNHHLIEQDDRNNIVFVRRDPGNSQVLGASKQGTVVDYEKYPKHGSFKGIAKDSTPDSAWSFDMSKNGQTPHKVIFFEAPIDAISYVSLGVTDQHHENLFDTRYVALNGLKPKAALEYVKFTDQQLKGQNDNLKGVALAVDNDQAGKDFCTMMTGLQTAEESLSKMPKFTPLMPTAKDGIKDWNDALRVHNQKEQPQKSKPSASQLQKKSQVVDKQPALVKQSQEVEPELEL